TPIRHGFRNIALGPAIGMSHRPCYLVGVGTALFFLSLTHVRERSAERRYVLVCTLRCHVPCGHAASRRSTCGVFHPGTGSSGPDRGTFIPRDPGGFRRPSSGPYRPSFEGSPSF